MSTFFTDRWKLDYNARLYLSGRVGYRDNVNLTLILRRLLGMVGSTTLLNFDYSYIHFIHYSFLLQESRPIDVESLCIVANEKVWAIRVDMLALNDSGNIVDCACIAAVAALAHFKYDLDSDLDIFLHASVI